MSDWKLGDRVQFTHTLHRRSGDGIPASRGGWTKAWSAQRPWERNAPPTTPGIVVGVRTLSDGEVTYIGYEDGGSYRPKRHFRAYLVAFDMRRKPVLVLPEHITTPTNEETADE